MRSKNMHYDPDNSEVIPFTKYEKIETPPQEKTKSARLCFNLIIITSFFAATSIITFLILMTLKLDQMIKLNNFKTFLPFLSFLLFTNLVFNKMIGHPKNNFTGLGKFFLYFTHNTCFLFIFLFIVLLALRIDESITLKYSFVFFPLDLIFAIVFLFICFIFPGLLDKNIAMYQEAFLVIAYYLLTLITMILLMARLDEIMKWDYYKLFIGELSLMFLHFCLIVKNLLTNKGQLTNELLKLTIIILIIFGILFPILKVDGFVDFSWKVGFIPIYMLVLLVSVVSSKSFLNLYQTEEQENY